jgi:hypothetical protein
MVEARAPGGGRRALARGLLHERITLKGNTDAGMAYRGDWARRANHSVVQEHFAAPVIARSETTKQSPFSSAFGEQLRLLRCARNDNLNPARLNASVERWLCL